MAEKPIDPRLIKLRDKYPASRSMPDVWDEVKRLVGDGDVDGAEEILKAKSAEPKMRVRSKVIRKTRDGRREFLMRQRSLEDSVRVDFSRMSGRLYRIITNAADSEGKISAGKTKPMLSAITKIGRETWGSVLVALRRGITRSIKFGIDVNMSAVDAGIKKANDIATKESAFAVVLAEAKKQGKIKVTSAIYKSIFDRVKTRQLKKGLFRNRFRGQFRSGTTLSERVWDLRNANIQRLKRVTASGIANGRPATAIAKDVSGMTVGGKVSRFVPLPGRGVYRSGYKNALRMVRTETNNAYVDAQLEYSAHKGYKVLWNLSPGHPFVDSCDDLAGRQFDPNEVPYPQHANEACFLTEVIPDIG